MEGLKYLTCDEIDKAWSLFYKWGKLTMRQRGVNPRHWKKWLKDNRRRGVKCDKHFPTISVEEGKAKMIEIIEKIRENGYYGLKSPGEAHGLR